MKWPFDYVTSYGRVWRKGKESEDWSVFCLGIGCVCVGVGVRVCGGGGEEIPWYCTEAVNRYTVHNLHNLVSSWVQSIEKPELSNTSSFF